MKCTQASVVMKANKIGSQQSRFSRLSLCSHGLINALLWSYLE